MNKSLIVFFALILTTPVFAQSQDEGQGGQPGGQAGHRPPPQAIEACKGKASGAVCSFIGRNDDTLTGTCFAPPSQGQNQPPLACRPPKRNNGQGGPDKGPPAGDGSSDSNNKSY